jgi:RND family efflux transporter MFP subunit
MIRTALVLALAAAATTANASAPGSPPPSVPSGATAQPERSRSTPVTSTSSPDRVRVRLVSGATGEDGQWVAANVQAARRATVATRLSAAVRAVHVQEGQQVQAGQLLVSLGDADLRGQLGAAEAALATASAHERRIRALAEQRAATPAELEGATAQRAQAAAAVAAVKANLEYTALRAPFAGTVQSRRVEPGDLVGPGQPLFQLEGSGLELTASLSDDEARGLAPGQRLRFRAGGAEGRVEVTSLTPGGDPLSHRRGLRARVLGDVAGLRSGAFARLEVPGAGAASHASAASGAPAAPAATWLPRSALVERGDLSGVFVAGASGKAELRWLSLGDTTGEAVVVRAGLRAGDRVIDAPGALRDGQEIEVAP